MEDEKGSHRAEFVVNNPEKLVHFYEGVFGFRALAQNPATGNWMIYAPKHQPGEDNVEQVPIIRKVISEATSFLYNFWVEDLGETTGRVLSNGGTIYRETQEDDDIMHIPGIGIQRFFCDPEGNMFGAIEPLKDV